MSSSEGFAARLEELATAFGSRSALARAAKVPVASLQSYATGSEPTRPVLVALAEAAKVSVHWLATGEGLRTTTDAPEGYARIGVYDIAASGSHIRGIIGGPTGTRLFCQRDIIGVSGVSASTISFAIEQFDSSEPLGFEPEIHVGDVLLVTIPPGHSPTRPSEVRAWHFLEQEKKHAIYLVADRIMLKLRRLRRTGKQKESVIMIDSEGKTDGGPQTGVPHDLIVWGPVVWRGGKL